MIHPKVEECTFSLLTTHHTPGKLDQESSGWNVKMVEMGKSLSSAFMANSGYRPWKISTMVSVLSEQRRTSRT